MVLIFLDLLLKFPEWQIIQNTWFSVSSRFSLQYLESQSTRSDESDRDCTVCFCLFDVLGATWISIQEIMSGNPYLIIFTNRFYHDYDAHNYHSWLHRRWYTSDHASNPSSCPLKLGFKSLSGWMFSDFLCGVGEIS